MPFLVPAGVALLPKREQSLNNSGTTASLTTTYGASPKLGSLLIALVYANVAVSNVSMTTTGYASQQTNDFSSAPTQSVAMFTKIAGASESTAVTAAATGATNMRLHIIEYSNVATATALQSASADTTAGTTNALSYGSSVLPVVDVAFVAAVGNMGGWVSWNNSFVSVENEARTQSGELISSAGALTSVTGTWTTARDAGGVIAVFPGITHAAVRPTHQAVNIAGTY